VKLSQVRLLVDDFGGSFRFLRDDLGLRCTFGDESSGYASFSTDRGTIAVFDRAEQGGVVALREAGDAALVVLEVDDADAAVERLGQRVVAGPVDRPDWGGRVAYVRDPDGNLFELFQSIPMAEE
jgi:catechol 2,3-dioxygenase-like lactoylglutathione lyase family enzyme